jgi:YVTN family beta-propeller protein
LIRYLRPVWHPGRPFAATLIATFGALAVLVPVTISGNGVAAAAPAAGYTATMIPATGIEDSYVAVNSATNTVYLGGTVGIGQNQITVVNGTTDTVTASIALAGPPQGIAVNPVTDTVYVSVNASPPAIDVIDGATNAVTATIPLPSQPGSNGGIAVDSATHLVYVAEYYASEVVVINGATNTLSATVNTGFNTYPEGLAVDATSDVVWVANELGSVIAINGTSDTVTQTVSLSGETVWDVDVDPATDTVYAAVQGNAPASPSPSARSEPGPRSPDGLALPRNRTLSVRISSD